MSDTANITPMTAGIRVADNLQFERAELCTDKAAARIFLQQSGSYVRFNQSWDWVFWDGCRWKRDDEGRVVAMALEVGEYYRALAIELHKAKKPEKLIAHVLGQARHQESSKGARDMLAVAKTGQMVYMGTNEFDVDRMKVNFRNLTLDFSRMGGDLPRTYKHSQADYITKVVPHAYVMDAKCPNWDSFLVDVVPSEELRKFVQRAVGYSLLGSVREQCFFILWGSGLNGKSTFLNVLMKLIGNGYAMQVDPRTLMLQRGDRIRADVARLQGARFVSSVETGEGNRLDEALVKSVTGGDAVVAEFKYKAPFQFNPEFKLWFATNHKPTIRGVDFAIWRRIRLVPFTETIAEDKLDPDLESKLIREAEGILNWAVDGAVDYLKNGLQPPREVVVATEEYRTEEDIVGQYLDERANCEPESRVLKRELYDDYKAWAGEHSLSKILFGKAIKDRGFEDSRGRGGTHFWKGLKLRGVTE